jgi:hypothetical protein
MAITTALSNSKWNAKKAHPRATGYVESRLPGQRSFVTSAGGGARITPAKRELIIKRTAAKEQG